MQIMGRVKDVDTKDDGSQTVTIELSASFTINGTCVSKPLPYGNFTLQFPKDSPFNGCLTAGQTV